jgi:hypothetical protein
MLPLWYRSSVGLEHALDKRRVLGSSPSGTTTFGLVAQLIEPALDVC